ncbi:MAG: thermonuclease family protein [Gammaproteobacteria bacterium]
MPLSGFYKKALQAGAFFIMGLAAAPVPALCLSDRYDETVVIRKVQDGDTVNLSDGRKLRLIGINTPELARDRRPSEAYAREARAHLQDFARQTPRWRVRWGTQKRDKYGRWLGHVFVGDTNLNADLLRQGLASVIAIPPNQWSLSCYQQQEALARREGKGLWGRQGYKIWPATGLPKSLRDFQFVQGRVGKVVPTRKSLWLELSPQFSVRIAKEDMQYFSGQNPYNWQHRDIEVRGWLNYHKGRLQMRIRHPAAVRLID